MTKVLVDVDIPDGIWVDDCIISYKVKEMVMESVISVGVKPLKALPEIKDVYIFGAKHNFNIVNPVDFINGWNACLKEILGETEMKTALEKAEKELSKPVLTEDEKVILRNLEKKWRWIARDKKDEYGEKGEKGLMYLYKDKPFKENSLSEKWFVDGDCKYFPFTHLFQFITWENEEPYNIEESLNESNING